jgi:3-methyladenine DNA glycosylase AlkD
VWGINRTVKDFAQTHPMSQEELVALVEELWRRPVHELRMAAVDLLQLRTSLLEAADLQLVERLIRESKTWALVDELAANVAGPLVERFPELGAELDRWAGDGDFWVRRSALLALLLALRRGEGDFPRFTRYADAMLHEREFFIRKAIGWVLRDTARKRPDLVYRWMEPRAGCASGVTLREVVKPLSPEERDHLLAARGRVGASRRRA